MNPRFSHSYLLLLMREHRKARELESCRKKYRERRQARLERERLGVIGDSPVMRNVLAYKRQCERGQQ